jgi:hypothetical protein
LGHSFKSSTEEIVKSVKQTDWQAELQAFSKEAAEEGHTLEHKLEDLVEKLPHPHLHHEGQERRSQDGEGPSDGGHEEDLAEQLKHFGQSLVTGTRELLSQVSSFSCSHCMLFL